MSIYTYAKWVVVFSGDILWQSQQKLKRSGGAGPWYVSESAVVASFLLSCRFVRLIWVSLEMGQLFAISKS